MSLHIQIHSYFLYRIPQDNHLLITMRLKIRSIKYLYLSDSCFSADTKILKMIKLIMNATNSNEIIKMLKTFIPSISMEYFIIVLKKCIDVSTYYDVKYLSVMHQWWNGRHVRLRGVWRDPCKFKSCLVHDSSANAELFFIFFAYIILMNII